MGRQQVGRRDHQQGFILHGGMGDARADECTGFTRAGHPGEGVDRVAGTKWFVFR